MTSTVHFENVQSLVIGIRIGTVHSFGTNTSNTPKVSVHLASASLNNWTNWAIIHNITVLA